MSSESFVKIFPQAGKLPVSDRGREREAAILRVATKHFLERGYADTALDAVAKEAGGSKSTLYRFFPSKTELFHAVVASLVDDQHRQTLDPDIDLYDCLVAYAFDRLSVVFTKRHWSLLRLVASERDRFPRIAQTYYDVGPRRSKELMVNYLRELTRRGIAEVKDPELSAQFFNSTLMHDWYLKHLYVHEKYPTSIQKKGHAEEVVRYFLRSHCPDHPKLQSE